MTPAKTTQRTDGPMPTSSMTSSTVRYQSNETTPIVITKRSRPANTKPLVFKHTCLFRFEDRQSCEAAIEPPVLDRLGEAAGEVSVQLYRRMRRSEALPAPFAKLLRRPKR